MSNSNRGAPRVIHEGIRDASGRAAIREVPVESTLVPLVFLIAEKQRDEPVFMSPSQIPALLGAKTLEKTSPYYSHATKLLETIAANASGFVCYPVQVPGSQKALLRLGIVEYDSSPDGNVEQSCWNEGGLIRCRTIGHYGWTNELVSTSDINEFSLEYPAPYDEFGQAQSTKGQFKRFTGEYDGGYYYPILDAEIEFKGEYGNRFGFNIQSVDRKHPAHVFTESPVALYKLSVVENTNGYTPRIVQTVYGENSVVFALQPCVDQNGKSLYLPDVFEEAYSLSQGNNVLNFGEFSRIHVYDDYLSNVQDAMWERLRAFYDQDLPAELVSSDWLGDQDALERARFGLINLVDGRYSDGVTPYRMVKIEKNQLIGSMNYAYAQRGQDGLEKLSNNRARFAQANGVLDTFVMDLKAEVESDFSYLHNQNRWDYSMVFDSGFATEAKDTLIAIGNCRQDVAVMLTPFSYGKFEWEDEGYVPHCVGATEEVLLQRLVYLLWDGNNGWIKVHYDVVINGVVYPWEGTQIGTYGTVSEGSYRVEDYFYDHPHPLIEVVESNVMISGQWPTSWKAKTSADVRVELRPRYETSPNMEEYSNPVHFDNNPTFHIDENGVIYFCIKGLNEVPEDPEDPEDPPVDPPSGALYDDIVLSQSYNVTSLPLRPFLAPEEKIKLTTDGNAVGHVIPVEPYSELLDDFLEITPIYYPLTPDNYDFGYSYNSNIPQPHGYMIFGDDSLPAAIDTLVNDRFAQYQKGLLLNYADSPLVPVRFQESIQPIMQGYRVENLRDVDQRLRFDYGSYPVGNHDFALLKQSVLTSMPTNPTANAPSRTQLGVTLGRRQKHMTTDMSFNFYETPFIFENGEVVQKAMIQQRLDELAQATHYGFVMSIDDGDPQLYIYPVGDLSTNDRAYAVGMLLTLADPERVIFGPDMGYPFVTQVNQLIGSMSDGGSMGDGYSTAIVRGLHRKEGIWINQYYDGLLRRIDRFITFYPNHPLLTSNPARRIYDVSVPEYHTVQETLRPWSIFTSAYFDIERG